MLWLANEYIEGKTKKEMEERLKGIERTRHLKLWHDQSTIANHRHLVFMVSCIYDPMMYYTNDEYFSKYNKIVDVQAAVESPEIYMIARSGGSDCEQLAYVDTRLDRLHELNINVKLADGHEIRDVMIFFMVMVLQGSSRVGNRKGVHFIALCVVSMPTEFMKWIMF